LRSSTVKAHTSIEGDTMTFSFEVQTTRDLDKALAVLNGYRELLLPPPPADPEPGEFEPGAVPAPSKS
jgi:hypothetical protein